MTYETALKLFKENKISEKEFKKLRLEYLKTLVGK